MDIYIYIFIYIFIYSLKLDSYLFNQSSNLTRLTRNAIKSSFIFNGDRIGLDQASSWSFGNEFH